MRLLIVVCCFFAVNCTQAQRVVDNNSNLWFSHWGDHRIAERWSLHSEFHIRRADFGATAQQLLIRPAVNYHLHEKVMLTGGYSYYENYRYGAFPIRAANWEHHGFAQVQFSSIINKVKMQHRYRWEHRRMAMLLPGDDPEKFEFVGYSASNRFRYRLWVTMPLGKDGPWSVNGYNEVFVSLGGTVPGDRFSQNRVSGLMGYHVSKELTLMAGYLYQYLNRPAAAMGADVIENNHTLHTVLVYNLGLRKGSAPVVPVEE